MFARVLIASLALVGAAQADDDVSDGGILNPPELSLEGQLERLRRGELGPMTGAYGYAAAKSGNHAVAREIFSDIAGNGNVQAMTWMSWIEDNGLGGPEDPDAAAEWDRRAMEAGSEIGMFNYGLDLLRGRGVPTDQAKGQALIRKAASLGVEAAERLVASDFDLDVVTPDADNWKYEKRLY